VQTEHILAATKQAPQKQEGCLIFRFCLKPSATGFTVVRLRQPVGQRRRRLCSSLDWEFHCSDSTHNRSVE